MSGLNRASQRFLRAYGDKIESAKSAADLARSLVEEAAQTTGILVHVVSGRAKSINSLRGKLRRKSYKRPSSQLTDLVGVRVITYYRDAIDPIVMRLRQAFDVHERASVDKRLDLGLRGFGYRSVHLVIRPRESQTLTPDHEFLRKHWFEVQVRSILEHAWAEIEHEVVYKAGIEPKSEFTRRFASLAGTLELLDYEFQALRGERAALIEQYVDRYVQQQEFRVSFDVARLLAFLQITAPPSTSSSFQSFAASLEVSCVDALKAVGLGTPASLQKMFRSRRFQYALQSFAALQGVGQAEVSHLARVVLAVAVKNVSFIEHHFPEMKFDPALSQFVERRAAR